MAITLHMIVHLREVVDKYAVLEVLEELQWSDREPYEEARPMTPTSSPLSPSRHFTTAALPACCLDFRRSAHGADVGGNGTTAE
jgi:hypothetical protein